MTAQSGIANKSITQVGPCVGKREERKKKKAAGSTRKIKPDCLKANNRLDHPFLPLTTTFRDYVLPSSTDVPPIESVILEEAPSPLNPLGVKGAGEGGIVGTGASLANAVANALGIEIKELPLSPERVRRLIRSRQAPPTSAGEF